MRIVALWWHCHGFGIFSQEVHYCSGRYGIALFAVDQVLRFCPTCIVIYQESNFGVRQTTIPTGTTWQKHARCLYIHRILHLRLQQERANVVTKRNILHLFSFAFGQFSITIRRQIRQFVIERNTSINSTTDCPISKTDWTLLIVNWTLCTTFGISKSFGQWAVSFITLVRMWEVPCQTVWNECRIVLKICHSLRTMLKLCWMTNWNRISPNCYAHRPISLHQLLGEVPSFAPV